MLLYYNGSRLWQQRQQVLRTQLGRLLLTSGDGPLSSSGEFGRRCRRNPSIVSWAADKEVDRVGGDADRGEGVEKVAHTRYVYSSS